MKTLGVVPGLQQQLGGFDPMFEIIENPSDDNRVFNIGDDLDGAVALLAGFDIDLEHATSSKEDVEVFVPCKPGTVATRQWSRALKWLL